MSKSNHVSSCYISCIIEDCTLIVVDSKGGTNTVNLCNASIETIAGFCIVKDDVGSILFSEVDFQELGKSKQDLLDAVKSCKNTFNAGDITVTGDIQTCSFMPVCYKNADGQEVTLQLAYLGKNYVGYVDPSINKSVITGDPEADGYEPCEDQTNTTKSTLDNFFNEISDDQKMTWTPSSPIDSINVSIMDLDLCNYIRVTAICPDGTVGCFLLSPSIPSKSFCLPKHNEITQVCFEVVQKNPGTALKDWIATTPTSPIEVNADGLDIN